MLDTPVRASQADTQIAKAGFTPAELALAKQVSNALDASYPGHLWGVTVQGPRLIVHNMLLAGNWGFVVFIPHIYSASSLKADCIHYAGELLEHYNVARGAADVEAIAAMPVNFAGHHKVEL